MTTDFESGAQPALLEPELETDLYPVFEGLDLPAPAEPPHGGPPRPVNWNLLTSDEAGAEWLDLNAWVNWLRRTYGLPPAVIPPLWHRHDELVWELSALHLHWLNSYDPEASASAPLAWHRDFTEARNRLREWVSTSSTRLDRDRPTRQTIWPGEASTQPTAEAVIADRDADFVQFVLDDVTGRRRIEDKVHGQAS